MYSDVDDNHSTNIEKSNDHMWVCEQQYGVLWVWFMVLILTYALPAMHAVRTVPKYGKPNGKAKKLRILTDNSLPCRNVGNHRALCHVLSVFSRGCGCGGGRPSLSIACLLADCEFAVGP